MWRRLLKSDLRAAPRPNGYPIPSSAGASAVMRANRRTNTRPEVELRSALHRAGMRFRKNAPVTVKGRRIRVDVVFPRARVAVFLDGCFWHSCPQHGTKPRSNSDYWLPKLRRNLARDRQVDSLLRTAGWRVIRVWEHVNPEQATRRISHVLRAWSGPPDSLKDPLRLQRGPSQGK
jgi:DNA mismatch endonuclease, patch repair protein